MVSSVPAGIGYLADILEAAGYQVRRFESAAAFLQTYDDCAASCIVTDLLMESIDGVELRRRLNELGSPLPVIVLTGHADVRVAIVRPSRRWDNSHSSLRLRLS